MAWEEDKEIITQRYFEAINQNNIFFFGVIKENLSKIRPIMPLIEFIISRLGTVTSLTIDNRVWDAEIVLRSALETFVKFLFITSAEDSENDRRIKEFWDDFAEINLIKQSEQAKKNLKQLGDSEIHRLAYLPMVLSDEEETKLRTKWTKAKRQRLEQRWSFTEMISSISKNYRGKPFEMILALTHSYRMSSHVMHGDETGILIIKERQNRSIEDYDIAMRDHFLRLINDSFVYCVFLATETMTFLDLEKKKEFIFDNQKSLEDIEDVVQKYRGKVFDDSDYDKYRSG